MSIHIKFLGMFNKTFLLPFKVKNYRNFFELDCLMKEVNYMISPPVKLQFVFKGIII